MVLLERHPPTLTSRLTQPHLVSPDDSLDPQDPAPAPKPPQATAYLWFDHVYPIRWAVWDLRHWFSRLHHSDTLDRLRRAVPPAPPFRLEVASVEPRAKDGGAFVQVRFALPNGVRPDDPDAADRIVAHLEKLTVRALIPLSLLILHSPD